MDERFHPFGNINVILVGDLMQLPPVMGSLVFSEPTNTELKAFHDGLGDKSLWKQFEPMILTQNHRQGEAKEFADALNRIREGIQTEEDVALISTRRTHDEMLDENAMKIFYFNKDVTDHNLKMLQQLPSETISVKAINDLPGGTKKVINKKKGTVANTEFLDNFQFKIGARVMIVKNIDLMDDLFNGAGGTVVAVEYTGSKEVHCIIVQFDNESVGQQRREKYSELAKKYKESNGTPIFREDHEYQLLSKTGKWNQTAKARVLQFPLRLFYASTAHKVQVSISKSAISNSISTICNCLLAKCNCLLVI
jgi:ATP-dependent exoDNAse (exonuclease V) alpha subunit